MPNYSLSRGEYNYSHEKVIFKVELKIKNIREGWNLVHGYDVEDSLLNNEKPFSSFESSRHLKTDNEKWSLTILLLC